jgi:hypothetical protein
MKMARQVGAGVGVSNGWLEYAGLTRLPDAVLPTNKYRQTSAVSFCSDEFAMNGKQDTETTPVSLLPQGY